MYQLLIEKTETGFRAILFDVYNDGIETLKSVVDILETDAPWFWAKNQKWTCNEGAVDVVLHESHLTVDFGRSKKLESKIKKICEAL